MSRNPDQSGFSGEVRRAENEPSYNGCCQAPTNDERGCIVKPRSFDERLNESINL
jgi:hypothetical protein